MIKICFIFRNNPRTSVRHFGISLNLKKKNGDETTKENTNAKKKEGKFIEREKEQRHYAIKLFKLLTSNPSKNDLEKIEDNSLNLTSNVTAKTEEETNSKIDSNNTSNIASRLNELIKSAELFETQQKQNIEFIKQKQNHDNKLIENLKNKEKSKRELIESIKNVAFSLGGDVKKSQEELRDAFEFSSGKPHGKSVTISDLKNFINQMKVESQEQISEDIPLSLSKALKFQTFSQRIGNQKIDKKLFSNDRLNIFSKEVVEDKNAEDTSLQVWDYLEKMSLLELKATPPRNYFQELIVWTQQGKLWHFPIDNEQGLDEERKIHFSEHIFLDKYIESWCPPGGPIRHFMELVITAISKNCYLSVNEKKEHLMWYKSYFENKKKMLIELGAMPQSNQIESGHQ